MFVLFFFKAEDGIRYLVRSRGLGDVYKRQVPALVATSTLSTDGRIESLTPSSVLTTAAGDWLIASVWCGFIYDLGYDALGEPLPAPAGWTSLGVRWIRRTTGSVVFSYRQGWYGVVGVFGRPVSWGGAGRPGWAAALIPNLSRRPAVQWRYPGAPGPSKQQVHERRRES